jgi:hypothetical protein
MDIFGTTLIGFEEELFKRMYVQKKWSEKTEQLRSRRRYDDCEVLGDGT